MNAETRDFEVQVLQRSHQLPVLVDFWAPWCGPCRALGPLLEQLAGEAQGRWVLVKVNTEDQPDLAAAFDIRSIPCVKLFHRGKVVNEFTGALPESQLRQWLAAAIPSPFAEKVTRAQQRLAAGETEAARNLLETVVAAEPANALASALLAECIVGQEPGRARDLLASITPDSDLADRAQAVHAIAAFIERDRRLNSPETDPIEAALHQAAGAIAGRDFDRALTHLVEVLSRRKDYADGAIRDVCKAIFQLLGIRHPIAQRHHRAFTSALYS